MSVFKKAERNKLPIKIGIAGPAGSGKTLGALLLAQGLGDKIAVIDTEKRRSAFYSDSVDFDVCQLEPPFSDTRYLELLNAAIDGGYDVIVIDSMTPLWSGEGGFLDMKAKIDATSRGNSYTNWNSITPRYEAVLNKIINSNVHIICTFRAKQGYVLQENDKGRQVPEKVGYEPQFRSGVEYEFDIFLDVHMSHHVTASKDITQLFGDSPFMITDRTGESIYDYVNNGSEIDFLDLHKFNAEEKTEIESAYKDDSEKYEEFKNKYNQNIEKLKEIVPQELTDHFHKWRKQKIGIFLGRFDWDIDKVKSYFDQKFANDLADESLEAKNVG